MPLCLFGPRARQRIERQGPDQRYLEVPLWDAPVASFKQSELPKPNETYKTFTYELMQMGIDETTVLEFWAPKGWTHRTVLAQLFQDYEHSPFAPRKP